MDYEERSGRNEQQQQRGEHGTVKELKSCIMEHGVGQVNDKRFLRQAGDCRPYEGYRSS